MRHKYMPWHAFTKPLSREQWLEPFSEGERLGIDMRFKLAFGAGLLLLAAVMRGASPWLLLPVAVILYLLCNQAKGPPAFEFCSKKELAELNRLEPESCRQKLIQLKEIQGFLLRGQVAAAQNQIQ